MQVKKPIPIIDKKRTLKNIKRMADKARASGVLFRPHFKTHISVDIGEWFKNFDVSSITVSSVDMAEYFSTKFNDIMICVPANIHQSDQMNDLAGRIKVHVLVDSMETTKFLGKNMVNDVSVWIEIDVGYERTGIPSKNIEEIITIARTIQSFPHLLLTGIVTHAGQSYHADSIEEIKKIHFDSVSQMTEVKDALNATGFADIEVSVGDTPTCSIMEKFEEPITDIRPGTFVFYDLRQMNIGSCSEDDISMTVACPVISKHSERNELVIYGGGAGLSKESLVLKDGNEIYGLIALPDDKKGRISSIKDVYVSSLSQEHGKIKGPADFIEKIKIGDTLLVLPVHACMTTQFHKVYQTLEGKILKTLHF